MNKELREDLEHLILCNDKTITPDLRDDVKMTLQYIDELEKENKQLKEQLDMLVKDDEKQQKIIIELQQTIDKAKNEILKNKYVIDISEVLNILGGESDE